MTTATASSARLALGWLVAGEWRAHPGRLFATALAIAVGVALGYAVHLVNGSATGAFGGAVASVTGDADLTISASGTGGLDEALYGRVFATAGVDDVSPVIELPARVGEDRVTLVGVDPLRAARVTPGLLGRPADGVDGQAVFATDSAFASAATGLTAGRTVVLAAGGRTREVRVAGTLPGVTGGERIVVMDIAAVQWRFGTLGRIDRLDVKAADPAAVRRALDLPAGVLVADAAAKGRQTDALTRAYRVNLQMLALVALVTGGFLVFSAQSLSVARRVRTFALLRTLGLPKGGVVAAVMVEGLAIGALGSAAGLWGGRALARLALDRLGGDLGAGVLRSAGGLDAAPLATAAFFALGVAASVAGTAIPARAASRIPPAVALRNAGDPIDPARPVPWRPAAFLLAVGTALAFVPPIAGLPVAAFVAMAVLLAGGVAGVPWLARRLLAPLSAIDRPVPMALAIRQLHGAPGRATVALSGIVASTALMIAMATMVTSFRGAVDGWLGEVLSADLYLRLDGAELSPVDQARLAAVPGVASVAWTRQLPLTLAPDQPPVTIVVREMADGPGALPLLAGTLSPPAGATPAWLSEPAGRRLKLGVGDTLTLPAGDGLTVRVAGTWRDYARQQGAVVIRPADWARATGQTGATEGGLTLAPGASGREVAAAIRSAAGPALAPFLDTAAPGELRRFALELFDRSFAITYVLEAVAIAIGMAGVAATAAAQVLARVAEFGMLRHLGVTKRQIGAMLAGEGALLGLIGGLAGIGLGLGLAMVLIHVVNPQSFGWTMATRVPWGTLAGVAVALIATAAATGVLAGRRALSTAAVLAVREDA